MSNKFEFEPPRDLKPKHLTEQSPVCFPPEVTASTSIAVASEAASSLGLISLARSQIADIKALGIDVESVGPSTLAQGNLHFAAAAARTMLEKLVQRSQALDLGKDEMKVLTYNIGYLVDKMSKAMSVSNKVAESAGLALGDRQNAPKHRPSFAPGSIVPGPMINAQPGSTVNIHQAPSQRSVSSD